jgi:hypothetical protein
VGAIAGPLEQSKWSSDVGLIRYDLLADDDPLADGVEEGFIGAAVPPVPLAEVAFEAVRGDDGVA